MGNGHGGGAASVGGRCGVGYGGGGRQDMGCRIFNVACGRWEVGWKIWGRLWDIGCGMSHTACRVLEVGCRMANMGLEI